MFLPHFHFVSLKVALEVPRQSWRFLEASCVSLGKNYSFTTPKQESHWAELGAGWCSQGKRTFAGHI